MPAYSIRHGVVRQARPLALHAPRLPSTRCTAGTRLECAIALGTAWLWHPAKIGLGAQSNPDVIPYNVSASPDLMPVPLAPAVHTSQSKAMAVV